MPVTFSDLPVDVLEKVIGGSEFQECLVLRNVTPNLRNIVDSSEIECERMVFNFFESHCKVVFDNVKLEYKGSDDGGCEVTVYRKRGRRTYRDDRNFKQVMMADSSTFLGNPKLKIDTIWLSFSRDEDVAEFLEYLKSLKFQLNIRSIQAKELKCFYSILPYLKPEKLEEMIYDRNSYDNLTYNVETFISDAKTDGLAILKHPKLKIQGMSFEGITPSVSAEFSKIFKSADFQCHFQSIIVDNWQCMRSIVQFMNPENVETVNYTEKYFTIDQFHELAGKEVWKNKMSFCYYVANDFDIEQLLQFKYCESSLELTDENLVKIRDNVLTSLHLKSCLLNLPYEEDDDERERNMDRINRIMSENPAYDPSTCRFSIPNSLDYFELEYNQFQDTLDIARSVQNLDYPICEPLFFC